MSVYEEFIAKNFGRIQLKGFKYLIRACELYPNNFIDIYQQIAKENNTDMKNVERDIRYYKERIEDYSSLICDMPINSKNSDLISAIVYTINFNERNN